MGKKILIALIIIVLLLALLSFFVYSKFFSDNIKIAILRIESGKAEVDTGNGWKPASNNMELGLNDKIKAVDGITTLTLYESIIIELEPNTEIEIKELAKEKVSVRQEKGSTWHKFTSVAGIKDYEVETPTTVATVRGTEFGVKYNQKTKETSVLVSEGKVNVKSKESSLEVKEFEKVIVKDEKIEKVPLTPEDKEKIQDAALNNLERLKKLREELIQEHKFLIEKAVSMYGKGEKELRGYLDKVDTGEIDDAKLLEKSPIKLPSMYRLKKLNDEIKEQQKLIDKSKK